MPCFVCDICDCVDNTAIGHYWSKDHDSFGPEFIGKQLCTECIPPYYRDGSPAGKGVWHNRFEKKHWSQYGFAERPIGIF